MVLLVMFPMLAAIKCSFCKMHYLPTVPGTWYQVLSLPNTQVRSSRFRLSTRNKHVVQATTTRQEQDNLLVIINHWTGQLLVQVFCRVCYCNVIETRQRTRSQTYNIQNESICSTSCQLRGEWNCHKGIGQFTFQRFAVRTNKQYEEFTKQGAEQLNKTLEELAKQQAETLNASATNAKVSTMGAGPPQPPLRGIPGFFAAFFKEVRKDLTGGWQERAIILLWSRIPTITGLAASCKANGRRCINNDQIDLKSQGLDCLSYWFVLRLAPRRTTFQSCNIIKL